MKLVVIESPYAGDVAANETYARACMADCLRRGESPAASHLLYTQPGILDDTVPEERLLGIHAGFAWNKHAALTAVYTDRGISSGMQYGIDAAIQDGRPVEYRTLYPRPSPRRLSTAILLLTVAAVLTGCATNHLAEERAAPRPLRPRADLPRDTSDEHYQELQKRLVADWDWYGWGGH